MSRNFLLKSSVTACKVFKNQSIILQVRAVENGNGIRPLNCPGSSVVHIIVVDVNDVSPQFDRISYRTKVKEDASGGTVLITVTVSGWIHSVFSC